MVDEQGAAFANKCMSFKSGSGISTLLITRTIEDAGGFPFASADRTSACLGYTVTPENASRLVPLLAVDCSFEKWDVRDAKATAEYEAEVASESAQVVLTENLYAAAYGAQSVAGRPFYVPGASTDAVVSFRDRAYGLNGAVLAATGIDDHSTFCMEVSELLADSPAGSAEGPAPLTYTGGESRLAAAAGYAHVALAFKGPESSAVSNVVKHLLTIAGAEAGVSGFTAAGIVGVYAGSPAAGGIVDSMCAALTGAVSADAVKRAKGLAKAEALFALDGGSASLADAMTASILESGAFSGPAEVAKAYDAVTDAQVKDALAGMLKSTPSLAAVGDISAVPYLSSVASRFS
jgi:predicted Zn-dependent peptidase